VKITKSQLNQIIKEELENVLKNEQYIAPRAKALEDSNFINNNTALYLDKAKSAKTTQERVEHMLVALVNLNNKDAGVFPRMQEMFNTTQNLIDELNTKLNRIKEQIK
tara:strand:- start:160 stop:483 length:324 start_codon:yes stop_codon:yes gene_type:complete